MSITIYKKMLWKISRRIHRVSLQMVLTTYGAEQTKLLIDNLKPFQCVPFTSVVLVKLVNVIMKARRDVRVLNTLNVS